LVASTGRGDSLFLYSFSIIGYARSWTNARHKDCGSTVIGAAFWIVPGISVIDAVTTSGYY
jgi:hypothetical protein